MNDTTCKDCGAPIHFVPAEGLWYHDELTGILACDTPRVQPAEV